jgi:hypothetical protein
MPLAPLRGQRRYAPLFKIALFMDELVPRSMGMCESILPAILSRSMFSRSQPKIQTKKYPATWTGYFPQA